MTFEIRRGENQEAITGRGLGCEGNLLINPFLFLKNSIGPKTSVSPYGSIWLIHAVYRIFKNNRRSAVNEWFIRPSIFSTRMFFLTARALLTENIPLENLG
jgi:hypothetical protein